MICRWGFGMPQDAYLTLCFTCFQASTYLGTSSTFWQPLSDPAAFQTHCVRWCYQIQLCCFKKKKWVHGSKSTIWWILTELCLHPWNHFVTKRQGMLSPSIAPPSLLAALSTLSLNRYHWSPSWNHGKEAACRGLYWMALCQLVNFPWARVVREEGASP